MLSIDKILVSLAASVAIVLGLAFAGGTLAPISIGGAATPPQQTARSQPLPDFTALVEQHGSAVVNISTAGRARNLGRYFGIEPGTPFYEFFRRFQIPIPEGGGVRQGVGSGFIVSADGYILTNAHVIADANEVTVRLIDEREFKAKVIGVDRRTDVGLVKIDARGLPTVKIGDPAKVKVGEWVAAIGSPFGLENTVTAGIVSAKSRSLPDEGYVPFIQTDVAINPGSSGGPLFNMSGEVIGINSQIHSRTGGYMGLSFAIPIDVAMKVKDDLQKYGKVSRGRLGVTIQRVSPALAESFGLSKSQGALVNTVEPGSPAEKAGIVPGDIILSVNGRPVAQAGDLARIIGETRPGTSVTLQVWRQGATRAVRVSLGEMPGETLARAEGVPDTMQGKLGLSVRTLTSEERRQHRTEVGLMVEEVTGPAARAGIRPGDMILALNGQPVKSVEELRRLVDKARGSVALLVQRDDTKLHVPIKLG